MHATHAATYRILLLLAVTLGVTGCELIGDIFQAGFFVGIVIVLLVLGIIALIAGRFRRG